jgi:hypothetical protein
MAGLTDQTGDHHASGEDIVNQARQAWQESMLRRLDELRSELHTRQPQIVADRSGGLYRDGSIHFDYWGQNIAIPWDTLAPVFVEKGKPCSIFDSAMLIYYLHTAKGTSLADQWIAFRELPDGAFYHQAFQGYSGDRLARRFGERPEDFDLAAQKLDGWRLSALASFAYAFQPLPRIRLAAALWPGDEDFPTHASILFDAASDQYLMTYCLALIGSGLAGRLLHAGKAT